MNELKMTLVVATVADRTGSKVSNRSIVIRARVHIIYLIEFPLFFYHRYWSFRSIRTTYGTTNDKNIMHYYYYLIIMRWHFWYVQHNKFIYVNGFLLDRSSTTEYDDWYALHYKKKKKKILFTGGIMSPRERTSHCRCEMVVSIRHTQIWQNDSNDCQMFCGRAAFLCAFFYFVILFDKLIVHCRLNST